MATVSQVELCPEGVQQVSDAKGLVWYGDSGINQRRYQGLDCWPELAMILLYNMFNQAGG
ncbi:hypothetical protein GCM10022631_10510 [Deinococcus rubellus]